MSPEQAELLLSDENIRSCAICLAALDRLQEKEFDLMEPELRKLGRFSESSVLSAVESALQGYTFMAFPGNGMGTKMTLSIFLRGLQLLHRDEQVAQALNACETYETLST